LLKEAPFNHSTRYKRRRQTAMDATRSISVTVLITKYGRLIGLDWAVFYVAASTV